MGVKIKLTQLADSEAFRVFPSKEQKQSSFSSADKPVGDLGWQAVSNGRYEQHHPIFNKTGSIIGYLVDGVRDLGYTYCCLYSDRSERFILSHVPFGMVWGKGDFEKSSYISIVEVVGKFRFFKQGLKFQRTSTFSFPSEWVGSELVYRFIDDGQSLLSVSKLGFCVINVNQPSMTIRKLFGNQYTHQVTGVQLSPNLRILAITMSEWRYTDPVKGEEIYQNTLRIFEVNSGEQIGGFDLGFEYNVYDCDIRFNEVGNVVSISAYNFKMLLKLDATAAN